MRTRFAIWLDYLIVAALLLMLVIELTGGFFVRAGGVRLSGRSPDRALFLALGLLTVRLLLDRRTGFLNVPGGTWLRRWRRVYDPRVDPPASRIGPAQIGAAFLIMCAIGTLLLYEQLRNLYAVPDLGDPLFSMWRLAWVCRQMQGDPRPLFDANIFHPERLTLAYSDAMLLPALMAAPLFVAGLHPAVVYNLLFLSGFLLSGLTTFLLVRRLTGCTRAAIVSGVIYAFYPYRFEHYSHLELQMTHWMPLGLLALHRFFETLSVRHLLLVTACAAAQLYSSMYYGIFFGLYGIAVGAVLWRARGISWRRLVRPAALAAAAGILLAIPLARPYLAAQARKGSRDVLAVSAYSATASDYLHAHERSARYGQRLSGGKSERELFPGISPLALTAAALIPPVGAATLAYAAGLAVAFDGSLGLNGLMYPYLYEWFLPIRGLRVAARFSVLVGLSLAVLAGFGTRRLLARVTGPGSHLVFAAVLVLVSADLQPILKLQPVWYQPPPIYAALQPGYPGGGLTRRIADVEQVGSVHQPVLAEFPLPADPDPFAGNLPYMYFSIWHGLPLVNGYSGFKPPDYDLFAERLAGFPDLDAVRVLRERGATHVTLNCALHGPGCEAALDAFAASPALRPVIQADWEGHPAHLYELVE